MPELIDYLYIDEERLGRYMRQITPPAKQSRQTVGINLNLPMLGGKIEKTYESGDSTTHAAIQKITEHLRETDQLSAIRPARKSDLWPDMVNKQYRFVYEEMTATKVLFTAEQAGRADHLDSMVVWVSDPDDPLPQYATREDMTRVREQAAEAAARQHVAPPVVPEFIDSLETPFGIHTGGTFLYLLQCHWTESVPTWLRSGCSALQLIANMTNGVDNLFEGDPEERLGRGSPDHPVSKLEAIGGKVMGSRQIVSLYLIRTISDEQCFVRRGVRYRVNDMIGYPLFIASL